MNKTKEINKERLITGKRNILEGKEREQKIKEAQEMRDQYEDKHLGGFERIFPVKDQEEMQKYQDIIERANKIYAEENGSIRMKMMEKEAKKLIKDDFKQRKKQKEANKAVQKNVQKQQKQLIKDSTSQPAQ